MGESQSILVLGLGSSGQAVARYCAARPDRFAPVLVADAADTPKLRETAEMLRHDGVEVTLGTTEFEGAWDVCVASPGIPPHAPIMRAAAAVCERTISEIQFAFEQSSAPWVAITGTNGKTTTTALTAHLLDFGGVPAVAVGNIGTPAIEAVAEDEGIGHRVLVAEVSSFQLALTTTFRPRVAVLLNLTPDHIDWHGSLERYAEDKVKVFDNLGPDDVAVLDLDDAGAAAYEGRLASRDVRLLRVSRQPVGMPGATVVDGQLTLVSAGTSTPVIGVDQLLIKGPHNVSNALAAACAAHALGVNAEDLRKGLATFEPIEHRLEPAGVVGDVEWFNDSKATNPDAVSKAVGAFGDRPFVLLLGGRNKGNDFGPLAREVAERASAVVLFGEACGELKSAFDATALPSYVAESMREAVTVAARIARPGEAVVLSPACASFDEFQNFEERGRVFKRLVAEMAQEASGT